MSELDIDFRERETADDSPPPYPYPDLLEGHPFRVILDDSCVSVDDDWLYGAELNLKPLAGGPGGFMTVRL